MASAALATGATQAKAQSTQPPPPLPQQDSASFDPDGTAHITRAVPEPASISPEARKWLDPIANLAKMQVVSVYYRLAPEYPFPAAVDDVVAVYKELLKTYKPRSIGRVPGDARDAAVGGEVPGRARRAVGGRVGYRERGSRRALAALAAALIVTAGAAVAVAVAADADVATAVSVVADAEVAAIKSGAADTDVPATVSAAAADTDVPAAVSAAAADTDVPAAVSAAPATDATSPPSLSVSANTPGTALRPGPDADPTSPNPANFDESKVEPYDLPDPLRLNNGTRVTTPEDWWKHRRPELLELFDREMYGRVPQGTPKMTWQVTQTRHETQNGVPVVVKELSGHLDNTAYPLINVNIQLTLTTPASAGKPVPVMLELGLTPEAQATLRQRFTEEQWAAYQGTGPSWQSLVLAKGWGYAILIPASVQPDNGAGLAQGVIGLTNKGQPRKPDHWGALRAWAWGASRALDYLETDEAVDATRVGIEGLSRYGKATLVAMAYDPRFAIAFVGSSGEGGAKLSRRTFGEQVENLASSAEYHWMAGNFRKYAGPLTRNDLPVDAHELIALCAPRPVFISSGSQQVEGGWVDAKGMFLAAVGAGPVYELLGKKGLRAREFPPMDTALIDGDIAFRQHRAGHTTGPNWPTFLTFASRYMDGAQTVGRKPASTAGRTAITGISHIAIYTIAPAEAERFYVHDLGAVKGNDPESPQGVRYYFARRQFVEVLPIPTAASNTRLDHVAFVTGDADRLRAHLLSRNVQAPNQTTQGSDGSRWFQVIDPEGNKIEFVQPPHGETDVPEAANPLSNHIIHVGFIIHDREREDTFFRNILGCRPYWYGGMKDDVPTWISQKVPDGTDWLEYMLPSTSSPSPAEMGVLNHFSLGVPNMEAAYTLLWNGARLEGQQGTPKIGRDAKWQLNLFDPDGTRAEVMELHAIGKPCCSPFTARD